MRTRPPQTSRTCSTRQASRPLPSLSPGSGVSPCAWGWETRSSSPPSGLMGLFGAIPFVLGAQMSGRCPLRSVLGTDHNWGSHSHRYEGVSPHPCTCGEWPYMRLGGLGIVVLFVALMPGWKCRWKAPVSVSCGPQTGISPQIEHGQDASLIYCSITAVKLRPMAAGMPLFDAVPTHSQPLQRVDFQSKTAGGRIQQPRDQGSRFWSACSGGGQLRSFPSVPIRGFRVFGQARSFAYASAGGGATLLITSDMLFNATHGVGDALRFSSFRWSPS